MRSSQQPDAERLATHVQQITVNRIATQRLTLPVMPAVAAICLKLLQNPRFALKEVTATLERDPLLTAQLLRLANAAGYGAGGVRSIDQAVTRLGSEKLRSMLIEACARKLFESRDPEIGGAFVGLLEHSMAVALLARDLAAVSGCAEAETAYLAGLLHDVGKPVMATMLLEAERAVATRDSVWVPSSEWVAAVQSTHRAVGIALAEAWGLAEQVQATIRDASEYDAGQRASPQNFVRFANAVAKVQGIYVGAVDTDDASALVMVGRSILGLDDALVQRLAGDLRARVRAHLG